MNDQWFMQAAVIERTFTARHSHPVVTIEEHDGVFRKPVSVKLIENLPGLAIHGGEAVVIAGQRAADDRSVGIKRGHGHRTGS